MTSSARPTALLLQLEFPTWAIARPWTYTASFAVREGLAASGVDCMTVPVISDTPCASPHSWVSHARRILGNRTFDQVWVWLVHAPLDSQTLEWIAGLAPVRVGILMESLRYDDATYAWAPHLKLRQAHVEAQIRYMTHVLAPDERDAADLNDRGVTNALWWPTMVPERFIAAPSTPPTEPHAVFHGTPYGSRERWMHNQALRSKLVFPQAGPPTEYHRLFDQLQQQTALRLRHGSIDEAAVTQYVETLRRIRLGEFTEWMAGLPRWAAFVNLPSLAQFYGGRVFEGIAAGRPVISWRIPGHPRNWALFEEGKEILLFSPDSPDELAGHIDRLLRDPGFAATLTVNAQRTLKRLHTSEGRLHQTLGWIKSGRLPEYAQTQTPQVSTQRNSVINAGVHQERSTANRIPLTTLESGRPDTSSTEIGQNQTIRPLRILILMPDNPPWSEAKGWCYFSNFGLVEGLEAAGAQCTVIPVHDATPDCAPTSWLRHAQSLCANQEFDQVWFWLHYCHYTASFLEWITTVAPVRVGLLTESMAFTDAERQDSRIGIHTMFRRQLPSVTHLLVSDERDEEELMTRGWANALWHPTAVPTRWINAPLHPPTHPHAVFYGFPHARRQRYFEHPQLANLLHRPTTVSEDFTDLPRAFNECLIGAEDRLAQGAVPTARELDRHIARYRDIRERLCAHWLDELRQWTVHISLPSVFQSYSGRVHEAMAAGRPVISTTYPDRPRTMGLFRDGVDILLCPNEPDAVVDRIQYVLANPNVGQTIAESARVTLQRYHSAELRAQQILRWIRTGSRPRYGQDTLETDIVAPRSSARPIPTQAALAADRIHREPVPNSRRPALYDDAADLTLVTEAQSALRAQDLPRFEQLLLANPRPGWRGWLLRAELAVARKDSALACEMMEASVRQGGSIPAALRLAAMHKSVGRSEQAWDWYEEVLFADAGCREALDSLVNLTAPLGRVDRLAPILSRFLARHSDDFSARLLLATVQVKLGNLRAAQQEHLILEQMAPSHEALAFLRAACCANHMTTPTSGPAGVRFTGHSSEYKNRLTHAS